ncbi:MAG: hypothetical protein P8N02_10940, partial [Actinomycetota bacterium]|nr:hypothetical protein [Actinomycetota bacterium]
MTHSSSVRVGPRRVVLVAEVAGAAPVDVVVRWSRGATVRQLITALDQRREHCEAIVDGLAQPPTALLDQVLLHDGMWVRLASSAQPGGARSMAPLPSGPVLRSARRFRRPPSIEFDLSMPAPPTDRAPKLSWFALLAPAAAAVVMALLFSPVFAIFGAMGPVMVFGRWWDARRSFRKDRRRFELALVESRAEAMALVHSNRDQLRAHCVATRPRVSAWLARAAVGDATLWQRRATHVDASTVTLGLGSAEIDWSDSVPAMLEMEATIEMWRGLQHVPTGVDVRNGGVAFVGDQGAARSAARAVVAQLVAQIGPADLRGHVALCPQHPASSSWEWCAWLPHLVSEYTVPDHPPAAGEHDAVEVIVIDGASALGALERSTRRAIERGVLLPIVVVDRLEELPAGCATAVRCRRHGSSVMVDIATGDEVILDVADGLDATPARDLARALARRSDPDLDIARLIPDAVALIDLCPVDAPEELGMRWDIADARRVSSLEATLGLGPAGPVVIDLVADGPHALIAGTTGAGKS